MIFISYSWQDAALVQPIVRRLHHQGVDVWVDFRDLDTTGDLESQLEAALSRCHAVLLFTSDHAEQSKWVSYERRLARAYGKPFIEIPVLQILPELSSSMSSSHIQGGENIYTG